MAAQLSRLEDVDRWIAAAYSDLGVARVRFADSPSAEGITACEAAEARLNELLDLRSALLRSGDGTPASPVGSPT